MTPLKAINTNKKFVAIPHHFPFFKISLVVSPTSIHCKEKSIINNLNLIFSFSSYTLWLTYASLIACVWVTAVLFGQLKTFVRMFTSLAPWSNIRHRIVDIKTRINCPGCSVSVYVLWKSCWNLGIQVVNSNRYTF